MCTDCLSSFSEAFAAPENASQRVLGWTDDSMSDADMLARLPLIAATAGQVDRYLRLWVARIRERHISYAEIGKALGVSRQAAWERFSRVVDPTKDGPASADSTNDSANDSATDPSLTV
jgi:hypothetical protein